MKQFYTNKRIWVITLTTGTVLLLATLVKTVFTTWELIHILIPLVLLSPIAASLFGKRLQVELNETVYMAILIAPLLVALLAKDSLSAAVCLAEMMYEKDPEKSLAMRQQSAATWMGAWPSELERNNTSGKSAS